MRTFWRWWSPRATRMSIRQWFLIENKRNREAARVKVLFGRTSLSSSSPSPSGIHLSMSQFKRQTHPQEYERVSSVEIIRTDVHLNRLHCGIHRSSLFSLPWFLNRLKVRSIISPQKLIRIFLFSLLVVSFNRSKFCLNDSWNPYAITFASSNLVGSSPKHYSSIDGQYDLHGTIPVLIQRWQLVLFSHLPRHRSNCYVNNCTPSTLLIRRHRRWSLFLLCRSFKFNCLLLREICDQRDSLTEWTNLTTIVLRTNSNLLDGSMIMLFQFDCCIFLFRTDRRSCPFHPHFTRQHGRYLNERGRKHLLDKTSQWVLSQTKLSRRVPSWWKISQWCQKLAADGWLWTKIRGRWLEFMRTSTVGQ